MKLPLFVNTMQRHNSKETNNIRWQLTLFAEPGDAGTIEQIRQKFNPAQFELIKAHVTLCRENEIENLEKVLPNLVALAQAQPAITIEKVLHGLTDNPVNHEPHITLMHPRNSTCTDEIFGQIEKLNLPTRLLFNRISLIEQENGGQWKILQEFDLTGKK